MAIKIYVPRDSSALSLSANKVAANIQAEAAKRGIEINLIRNGSRGLFWLETMVEVATSKGRIAYGPVMPKDVASLFDSDFMSGASARGE